MIFLKQYRPDNLSNAVRQKGILAIQREMILQTLLNILLGIYTVGFAAVLIFSAQVIRSGHAWVYLLFYLIVAAITLVRSINYNLRAAVIILALQALGAAAFLSYGLSGTGIIFLFASILLATLLFNQRSALLFSLLALAILAGIGGLMLVGVVPLPPISVMANSGNPSQWFIAGLVLTFATGITTSSLLVILRGMNTALLQREKLTRELEIEQASLERRVEERSADLRNRVEQFDIASQIAREISGETDLDHLLNNAAALIRERFGFYHVGIFVNDPKNEYALLQAATGEAGRLMLESSHRLKIGEIGLVGYVIRRGEARISASVTNDLIHYKNPLLPDTRSEMALPLRSGERVIGALDVQSVLENAFSQEDVRILQIIADQLAIAFEKMRLVAALKQSVDELEISSQNATQKAWSAHLHNTRRRLAYHYPNPTGDILAQETEQGQEAQRKGQLILQSMVLNKQGKPVTTLAVPIKLRNQVLGVVDILFESARVSPELISLIETTVERMAVSLENARLVEEIQLRAEREQMIGEISSKVRAASDVDSVLRIATQEIARSLGAAEVMVQLRKST